MCKRQRLDVLLARLLAFSRMTVSVVGVSLFFFPLCRCQSGREAEMEAVGSRADSEKHLGDMQTQGPRKHTCSGSNLRDIQERSRQWFGGWLSSDNLREELCSDKHLSSLSATLPPPRHRRGNVIQCQSAQRNAVRADRSTVRRGTLFFPRALWQLWWLGIMASTQGVAERHLDFIIYARQSSPAASCQCNWCGKGVWLAVLMTACLLNRCTFIVQSQPWKQSTLIIKGSDSFLLLFALFPN